MGKIITVLAMLFIMSSFVKAQTWESCTNGLEGKSIKTLAVIGQRIFAGTGSGWVYVSYDNGDSWMQLDSIPAKPTVFAPYKDDILMGTYSNGMMQSLNGGSVWMPLNKDTLEKGVRIIEVVGDNLFVFTEGPPNERAYGRISRSTDGGNTWTPVLTGKSYNWLYSLTSIGSLIFVSTSLGDVYRSDNFGDNWTNVGIDLPDKNIYTIKAQGNNLLAGSEEGRFFISSDLGQTWRNANKGFPDDWVSAITSCKQNIFVGTNESGVYLSTDNGDSWNDFSDTLWNHRIQNGCLIVKDEYVFCSTGGYNGLYRKDISALINPNNGLGKLFVGITNDSAYAGQLRNLKLVISGLKPEEIAATATNFSARIRFQKTILTPLKKTERNVINDSIYMNIVGTIGSSYELAKILVMAGLGNVETTTIDIVDFKLMDNSGNTVDFDIKTQPGIFKLLGICHEGETRLINPSGKVEIMQINPTPISNEIEININLIEKGATTLTVFNLNGVKMKEINLIGESRIQTINLEVSDFSNGLYFIQLQTPTVVNYRKFLIVK